MADDFPIPGPKRLRSEDYPLEQRLQAIEFALQTLTSRVTSNPLGGGVAVVGEEGSGSGSGGGGDAGGTLVPHEILNDAHHIDTVTATPVSQDLIMRDATGYWVRFGIGSEGYSLQVVSGLLAWGSRAHNLLSTLHGDTTAASVARGDLITGQGVSAKWVRLAKGTSGQVLRSDGTDLAWSDDQHNLLSARHGDTTTASATRGDIITAQGASPTWARLAKSSTATHVLKAGANEPAWGQVAHSELSGVGANDHHNQSHNLFSADHPDVDATDTPANLDILQYDSGSSKWKAQPPATATAHALLSATHSDTTAASVARGDLVTGQGVSPTWTRLAKGTSGQLLRSDGTDLAWSDDSHALLSTRHSDAAAGSVTRGDLIVANSTPKFARLAVGASGTVLVSDGTDVSWGADAHNLLSTRHGDTLAASVVAGDILYGNSTPKWARLAKGSDGQILKLASGLPTWANPNTVSTSSAGFQAWRRLTIGAAGTAKGQVPGLDAENTGIGMFRSGTIVGVAVDIGSDLSNSSSDWYEVEVYKRTPTSSLSWSATGVTARITGDTGDQVHANGSGSVTFSQGDQLTMFDQRQNLGASSIASKATVFVVFDN